MAKQIEGVNIRLNKVEDNWVVNLSYMVTDPADESYRKGAQLAYGVPTMTDTVEALITDIESTINTEEGI